MITASTLCDALTSAFVEVLPGAERSVVGLELVEPGDAVLLEAGDLVVLVGARTEDDVVGVVQRAAPASGIVLRRQQAASPRVRELSQQLGLSVLVVEDDAPWSWVVSSLRTAVDRPAALVSQRRVDVYSDLFELADELSSVLGAPVTIEDATSRVLAYSSGQDDVDEARRSTIVGRQVPREVRSHFRALGVFRRLASTDEPFLVPGTDAGVLARYVVPVRAGGEWLGSIWAVVDQPVPPEKQREVCTAAQVVALYLLRLRTQSELQRQVQLDSVRNLLATPADDNPGWLAAGPWRVVILRGPADLDPEARCEVWLALARRHGWRQPLLADLGGVVYAIVAAAGDGAGTWPWLRRLVTQEARTGMQASAVGGRPTGAVSGLPASRALADELTAQLGGEQSSVVAVEERWSDMVVTRAVAGLEGATLLSPAAALLGSEHAALRETLRAVLDHWGNPRRAAEVLGVHPNTVRYRMARLGEVCDLDLHDPVQRLAVRLELEAVSRGDLTNG
ncbi:PucR family transcriptional regulator [Nocardioides sp. T5]|uniref:PucR family transcriptional regulator n=1 Tax=Nocardioides sp. T5 TaxID=3400182 RepID=UPI003A836813